MSIKPVGLTITNLDGSNENPVSITLDGKPLYYVPDTHRVVSVELLDRFQKFTEEAAQHYSVMNDEVCPSYSDAWIDGAFLSQKLREIIEDKL